jgi:hypothetical protein
MDLKGGPKIESIVAHPDIDSKMIDKSNKFLNNIIPPFYTL